jgi:outer membrane protein assembly factor BamB
MFRKVILLAVLVGAVACGGALVSGCLMNTTGARDVSAKPQPVETSPPPAGTERASLPTYSYSLNERFCDNQQTRHMDSMPVLWGYIKWTGGDGFINTSNFVMDGEYVYQLPNLASSVTRYRLRTGEVSFIADLADKPGWKVAARPGCLHLDGAMLYVGGSRSAPDLMQWHGALWAVCTTDGTIKWVFLPPNDGGVYYALILPGGKIIALAAKATSAQYFCLDKATGQALWQIDAGPEPGDMLACGENVILINHNKTGWGFRVVETNEGKTLWESATGCEGPKMATDGSKIFVQSREAGTANYGIIAFDCPTGKELWRAPCGGAYALDGNGRILTTEPPQGIAENSAQTILLDAATGKTVAKLPIKRDVYQTIGDWAITQRTRFDAGPPMRTFMTIEIFNTRTGEIRILLDGSSLYSKYHLFIRGSGTYPSTDGYLIVEAYSQSGGLTFACLEDMRFHPDATRLVFDLRCAMLDKKMKARIAELIEQLGNKDWQVRENATKELQSLMDLPYEQLEAATKEDVKAEIRVPAAEVLKKAKEWRELRQYVDELGPIYLTALIRHTPDLAVQQKAIDRLKQITGQDFGLKPSAEWVKDQKEPSDKYDAWWLSNRDKLTWSDKEDKYIASNEGE